MRCVQLQTKWGGVNIMTHIFIRYCCSPCCRRCCCRVIHSNMLTHYIYLSSSRAVVKYIIYVYLQCWTSWHVQGEDISVLNKSRFEETRNIEYSIERRQVKKQNPISQQTKVCIEKNRTLDSSFVPHQKAYPSKTLRTLACHVGQFAPLFLSLFYRNPHSRTICSSTKN